MAAYKILPELSLIIEYFSHEMEANEVIDFKRQLTNDKNYEPDFNIISCVSDAIIGEIKLQSAGQLVDAVSKVFDLTANRKTAVITKSPKQVVLSTIYQSKLKEESRNYKVVSTLEAALNWVSIPREYSLTIEKHFESLKKLK